MLSMSIRRPAYENARARREAPVARARPESARRPRHARSGGTIDTSPGRDESPRGSRGVFALLNAPARNWRRPDMVPCWGATFQLGTNRFPLPPGRGQAEGCRVFRIPKHPIPSPAASRRPLPHGRGDPGMKVEPAPIGPPHRTLHRHPPAKSGGSIALSAPTAARIGLPGPRRAMTTEKRNNATTLRRLLQRHASGFTHIARDR